MADGPERVHDDARPVGQVCVADGSSQHAPAGLLDEKVGIRLAHVGGAFRVEDADDDARGVDVGARDPLRRVSEELRAGFEVEVEGDDGAGCVEDAYGVGFDGWHGGIWG